MPLSVLRLVASAGILAACGSVLADDVTRISLEELLAAEIDKVSGVSRMEQLIAEAPAAITVLTHKDIRRHGWRTLAELLRSAPGINLSYNSLYTTASIRGQTSALDMGSFMLLLIDGQRLTSNISDASLLGEDMPIDLEWIDRVEIITGASSAVYGSNAVLAVVNIITHAEVDLASAEATLDIGADDYRSWRIAGRKSFDGGGHAAVSASRSTGNGYLDNDANETTRWLARFAKGDFSFTALHIGREKSYPHLNPPLLVEGNMDTKYTSATLNWRKAFPNAVHADVSLQYGESESAVGFGNPDLLYRKLLLDGSWRAIDASLSRKHGRHTLLLGFDYLDAPDTWRYGIDFTPTQVIDEREQDMGFSRHAIFVQDIWNPSPRLGLHVALRHEKDKRYRGSLDVPRLGLVYRSAPNTALKLNYGESFRAHPAYEVASLPNVVRRRLPDKPPEQVKQWEMRIEHDLDSATRIDTSLYRIRSAELLRYAPDQTKLDFLMDEASTLSGLEAGILWRRQDGSRLRTSVTLQNGDYDSDGAKLFNSPEHMFKLAYSRPLTPIAATLGFEAIYTGSRSTLIDTTVPSYTVSNLTLSSMPGQNRWEWQLGIYNVFDQRYSDPSSYTLHLGEIAQEGRSWRARLKWRF
jgi:outer membrane receptor protein involved in Fe transport